MSLDDSTPVNNPIAWPKGNNSSFFILPVPNVTQRTIDEAMSFIRGNCYFLRKNDSKKYKPHVERRLHGQQQLSQLIQLESLFTDAVGEAANDDRFVDYHRFQSNPTRQRSLLKCEHIRNIVASVQNVVTAQCGDYAMSKLSVLYSSIPGGKPQGLHVDDPRSDEDVGNEGEMISVIFALQNDTKVDIAVSNRTGRQTFPFPSCSIFMFNGSFRHGGSAYSTHNIRLHMYFVPSAIRKSNKKDNSIPIGFTCPVSSCSFNIGGRSYAFTKTQLYNHWRDHHKRELGISVEKYRSRIVDGRDVIQCPLCKKGFTTGIIGLKRHQRTRCKKRC
jgi:hypothetical protein